MQCKANFCHAGIPLKANPVLLWMHLIITASSTRCGTLGVLLCRQARGGPRLPDPWTPLCKRAWEKGKTCLASVVFYLKKKKKIRKDFKTNWCCFFRFLSKGARRRGGEVWVAGRPAALGGALRPGRCRPVPAAGRSGPVLPRAPRIASSARSAFPVCSPSWSGSCQHVICITGMVHVEMNGFFWNRHERVESRSHGAKRKPSCVLPSCVIAEQDANVPQAQAFA